MFDRQSSLAMACVRAVCAFDCLSASKKHKPASPPRASAPDSVVSVPLSWHRQLLVTVWAVSPAVVAGGCVVGWGAAVVVLRLPWLSTWWGLCVFERHTE